MAGGADRSLHGMGPGRVSMPADAGSAAFGADLILVHCRQHNACCNKEDGAVQAGLSAAAVAGPSKDLGSEFR